MRGGASAGVVRVVSLGAAVEEPTEENRGMRADGILVPMGYTVVGTLFHEPLRAWVDDEGLHRVQWGDARDGRRVAATPAKGAANVKDAVACVAAELARRVRENVDPVLPQLPPPAPPAPPRSGRASAAADDETAARAPTADARRTPRRSCDEDRTAFAHCATRAVCGTREEAPCDPWRAGRSTRTPSRAEARASCARDRARARREGGSTVVAVAVGDKSSASAVGDKSSASAVAAAPLEDGGSVAAALALAFTRPRGGGAPRSGSSGGRGATVKVRGRRRLRGGDGGCA